MGFPSVLITTYHQAFLHRGGGEYELLETALTLRKLGVVADVYSPYSRDIGNYDVVLHFSVNPGGLPLLESLHTMGKKIILWPNYWAQKSVLSTDHAVLKRFLNMAELSIFKSETEKNNFASLVSLEGFNTLMLPTGIDPCFVDPTPERLFRDSFGVESYVLWIGILEPRKNQLEIIKALHDLEMPLVFIGNYRDTAYYNACRKAAPEHFLFLEPMEYKSDILRAAIRECSLYIEPTLEPAGKSVLEAAICGAKILVSDSPWEREHLGDAAIYVNAKNTESIREGVMRGLAMQPDPTLVCKLARKHLLPQILTPLVDYLGGGQ